MLRNYVTTALRSLRRHLGYTTINVVGLGVGIAVSILLLLFVRSELAVNDLFPNAELSREAVRDALAGAVGGRLNEATVGKVVRNAASSWAQSGHLAGRTFKRRTRVVGVFPSEESAETLATAVLLRVSEDWAERRYLDMGPLHALFPKPTKFAT